MKKALIKLSVFIIVFITALITISLVMNRGNNSMTAEMAGATFPLITMEKDGMAYNMLHGYALSMNTAYQRETVTELSKDRRLSFVIAPFEKIIEKVEAQVRSLDGTRLIENPQVTSRKSASGINCDLALKDLIEEEKEYMLVLLLHTQDGQVITYYTRIVWSSKMQMHAAEKLAFAKEFHEAAYDRTLAEEKQLARYLESDSTGDNTTFHKVNIHSSFFQITWGDLEVEEVAEPIYQMRELASQTGTVVLSYRVCVSEENRRIYYDVEEAFRVRYLTGAERMYLLSYDRTMTQIPEPEEGMLDGSRIRLGIVGEDFSYEESEDGKVLVFCQADRLISYNLATNRAAVIFSFVDEKNQDERTLYREHNLKVLDVEEGGDVNFAVYGYMNRGKHEGEVGLVLYRYDSAMNTTEELLFIPVDKSAEILAEEFDRLLYFNRNGELYFYLDGAVYCADSNEKSCKTIATVHQDDKMYISESGKMLVWQEEDSGIFFTGNLSTGQIGTMQAEQGTILRPLGFISEDFVYGLARSGDLRENDLGQMIFPMYRICIQNSEGNLLKELERDGIYVTGCDISEDQITLEQVQQKEDGSLQAIQPEYIMNNETGNAEKNRIVTLMTQKFEKETAIETAGEMNEKTLQVLFPKELLFEGSRSVIPEKGGTVDRYYVYTAFGVDKITTSVAAAVLYASDAAGVVTDDQGKVLWFRGNRATRNQIMAIKEQKVSEGQGSLAACLDAMLAKEGVTVNTQRLLDQGMTAQEILEEELEDAQVLDLTGCSLDMLLHYVNQDDTVLALLANKEAVLVTGFNEFNAVIMDPASGSLYKKGLKDSDAWFAENGNRFLTYVR